MVLRTAALYDRDPRDLNTTAEMLALRGVHPTVDAARSALLARARHTDAREAGRAPPLAYVGPRRLRDADLRRVRLRPLRQEPRGSPSVGEDRARGPGFATVWVVTWVFPLSFMIAMGWGCDSNSRDLGRRALIFYDSEPDSAQAAIAAAKHQKDAGHNRRQILGTILLIFSVALPIAFIGFVDHGAPRAPASPHSPPSGGLVALSLVIATAVIATRR